MDYNFVSVAVYTLLTLPNQLIGLAPVIALLGCIVALANMDRYNELTIISCTGFPPSKLIAALALPTLLLMTLLWAAMEYVTPQLQLAAEQEKTELRERNQGFIPGGGVWSTDGQRYMHLGRMTQDNEPGNISLFQFDESGELVQALWASKASVSKDRRWLFQNVKEKVLVDGVLEERYHRELEIANLWSRDELPTLTLRSNSMNLSVLYRYAQYLTENDQPADRYLNAFWQRLLMPLTVGAMVLLGTAISAGISPGRDRSFGINIGIGAALGIVFYLATQIIFSLGQLLQLSIPLVALLPTLIILTCAIVMLRRMRW
jgi:lipopolysaccharide export system permease protein